MEIILKAVSKKIGYTQVLDNINCLFLDGKIYGIVGYNGSGKTMLLRTIAGLVIPTSGTIDFDGKRLHRDISISATARPANKPSVTGRLATQRIFLTVSLTRWCGRSLNG